MRKIDINDLRLRELAQNNQRPSEVATSNNQLVSGVKTIVHSVNKLIDKSASRAKSSPLISTLTTSDDVQTVTGSIAYDYGIAPNGHPGVRCVFSGSVQVTLPKMVGQLFSGEAAIYLLGGKATNLDSVTFRVYQSVASNQQNYKQYVFSANPVNNHKEQGGVVALYNSELGWGKSGTPSASFKIDEMRLTMVSTSAATATVWLLGATATFKKRPSRICVTLDDGYSGALEIGQPLFARAGIPTTMGVVPSAVDNNLAGYVSLPQLKSYVGMGNAVVAHAGGSLPIDYPNAEAAIDDVASVIKWIKDNDLGVENFDECYIWPQGSYQSSAGDTSFMDEILNLGVNIARATNKFSSPQYQTNIDALSKYSRLAVTVIGHSWGGSTAAEVTNIAEIVAQINAIASTGGLDAFIILHKVVPTSTVDGEMFLSIRESDLQTIINAIQSHIESGNLEAVTMPMLAASADHLINKL